MQPPCNGAGSLGWQRPTCRSSSSSSWRSTATVAICARVPDAAPQNQVSIAYGLEGWRGAVQRVDGGSDGSGDAVQTV